MHSLETLSRFQQTLLLLGQRTNAEDARRGPWFVLLTITKIRV